MPRKNARPAQKKALKRRQKKSASAPKRILRPAASMVSVSRAGPGYGEEAASSAALLSLASILFRDEKT